MSTLATEKQDWIKQIIEKVTPNECKRGSYFWQTFIKALNRMNYYEVAALLVILTSQVDD